MKNAGRNKDVDKDGIRLAPQPINPRGTHVLPAVRQEFIIEPKLVMNEQQEHTPTPSTASDYQPKKVDVNKRWKRGKRGKNIFCGIIMFVLSAAVILPYILGAVGVQIAELPWKYIMSDFNAVGNIVEAIKITAANGAGDVVNQAWIHSVPDFILIIGLLFVIFNIINSLFGIFGASRPRRYAICAVMYLLCVLAIFIASLIGAEIIGIKKIDFMADFINGFRTSELFSLMVFAVGNFVVSLVCQLINPIRTGYMR